MAGSGTHVGGGYFEMCHLTSAETRRLWRGGRGAGAPPERGGAVEQEEAFMR